MAKAAPETRQQILDAALKQFAERGYAAASVQDIVDAARVTKPALYYYFQSKAGLYRALVDWAFEERYRIMQEAAARGGTLAEQLTAVAAALFAFVDGHREMMRLAFATAFAAPGEVPPEAQCLEKAWRNFEFIHGLIQHGLKAGELSPAFTSHEMAMALVGMINLHVMAYLVEPKRSLNGRTARRIVELFLAGARAS